MSRSERTETTTVVAPLTAEYVGTGGGGTELPAELRYDVHDPYAVAMVFATSAGDVSWRFARELLADGVFAPVGEGDVQVWPCLSTTCAATTVVELHGVDEPDAVVQLATRDVVRFLDAADERVPPGTESSRLDLDSLAAALLGAG